MPLPRPHILSLAAWAICSACLAGGFALGSATGMLPLALLPFLAGAIDRRLPALGLSWLALAGTVALSAGGVLLAAPPLWMTLAAGSALAAWDQALLAAALTADREPAPENEAVQRRLMRTHLLALGLALGAGLLAAGLGQQISLSIPFLAMLVGIALLVLSLDRVWRALKP